MMTLVRTIAVASITVGAFFANAAFAEYPRKPVEFVVPWGPGDLEDVLTRMIAEDFQKKYGTPAAVINKPGGGGGPFPGAIYTANQPADGYTIGSFVIGVPVLGHKIGIPQLTPEKFDPLGIFLTYPFVIVAGENAPYDDVDGLAEYAKSNDVILGHFGTPLPPTKVTLALAKEKGFSFAADAAFDSLDCNSLASGDIDVMNTTLPTILPCIDKLKVLASIGERRIPLTPDTPTVGEISDGLDLSLWNGLFVVKDTPIDVREKIISVAKETIASDRAQKLAAETGALLYWQDAETAAARIKRDSETFKKIDDLLK